MNALSNLQLAHDLERGPVVVVGLAREPGEQIGRRAISGIARGQRGHDRGIAMR